MTNDVELLGAAIDLALSAREQGNHPFGSLLADADGKILLMAENTVTTESDVTGHAETNLVRLASQTFSREALTEMSLYTSTEPCAMCAGAIYWSGIRRVVFALAESELAAMTGNDPGNPTLSLPCREVFAAGQHSIEVLGPYEIPAARSVHDGFWTGGAQ
ncbi:MAG TPA: nucleoside deaminase [Propionibacteriaceae bacterium]